MVSCTVGLMAALDKKGPDCSFIYEELRKNGCQVVVIDTGVHEGAVSFPELVRASARLQPEVIGKLRTGDQATAVKAIKAVLKANIVDICRTRDITALLGLGGTKGTNIITCAMRKAPKELPKVCISTVAQHENWKYTKASNILLYNPCVDVGGVNSISREKYSEAAFLIACLAKRAPTLTSVPVPKLPSIGISMMGVTTKCVELCSKLFRKANFEPLPFHAVGTGGRNLEKLVKKGTINAAVLDLTLHEVTAFLEDGLFSAGGKRLNAPGDAKIPHLLVPGGVDFNLLKDANFEEAKKRHPTRLLHSCDDHLTAMRTTEEENRRAARFIAEKATRAFLNNSPVACLIPAKGFSTFDETLPGWHDAKANQAFISELVANIHPQIPVKVVEASINDEQFAHAATEATLQLIAQQKRGVASSK